MTNDEHPTDDLSEPNSQELQVTSQPTESPPQPGPELDAGATENPIEATERFTATDRPAIVSGEPATGAAVPTVGLSVKSPVELEGQIAHFRVLETLGSGGFGTVVRAYDTQLDREVAVKIIRSRSIGNKQIARQFQEEARAAAQLRHPNIVTVHQSGEYSNDQVYIVYDYIRGPTLREVLRKRRPLPMREAVSILARIARALGYAHAKGIVHRDVKPENVLIEKETDEPHVADFGCARRTPWQDEQTTKKPTRSRPSRANNFVGTPVYFSPEQASGRSELAGAPADVWALGVILDELVTGDRSFLEFESDRGKLMQAIQHIEPTPIRERAPSVDRDLAAVWHHCICKDPQQRYPSAARLADDLENWLRGLPVSVRPLGIVERFARWGKRNPGLAASIASVFLAVSLGFAVSFFFYVREYFAKRDNVRNCIDRLFSEPPDGVASILRSLQQPYLRQVSRASLQTQWDLLQSESGSESDRKKMRIALAEFSLTEEKVDNSERSDAIRHELVQSIYKAEPEELALLLDHLPLQQYPKELMELHQVADNSSEGSRSRLRAICALAKTEADQLDVETKQRFAQKAAQFLQSELGQNTDLSKWVPLLSPLRVQIRQPLETALAEGQNSVGRLLYYFYRDDVDFLVAQLPTAQDEIMPDLLTNLSLSWQKTSTSPESIWRRLQQEVADSSERLTGVAYSQAVGRLWLAGLHATPEQFREPIPILNDETDPSAAAYLTSRACAYNVQLARLMGMLRACLERGELAAAQHMLLAIDHYPPESELEQLTILLRDCYQHPDSGLHATAAWMMHRWGIASVEPTASLSRYTSERNWRVGPRHLLMIRCPVTNQAFKMGSTPDELALARVANRSQHEGDSDVYHFEQIPWAFEVSAAEVRVQDYREFLDVRTADLEARLEEAERMQREAELEELEVVLSNLDSVRLKIEQADPQDPVTSVSWHDAIAYCTWLSQQEGLGLCYGTIEEIERARQETRVVGCDVRQTGYRLPRVAEWECVCRANSTTIWSCGNDESLLEEYAIYSVNSKDRLQPTTSRQPNRWGLFDMLGNASEWTTNLLRPYPRHENEPHVEAVEDELEAGQERLGIEVRGGNYSQTADTVRSAHRESTVAITVSEAIGFRIARTLDPVP